MNLPEDVKQYAKKNLGKRIAFCAAGFLFVLGIFCFLYPSVLLKIGKICAGVLFFVLFLIPVLLSKILPVLFDRSWQGQVLAVSVDTKPISYSDNGKKRICEKNTVFLLVKKENGRTKKIPVKTFVSNPENGENAIETEKPEDFAKRYRAGDSVYHFAGFKTKLVLSGGKNASSTCLVCASDNAHDAKVCQNCGHTLIKP